MNLMNLGMMLNCSIDIDPIVPAFTSSIVKILKVVIPIVLIVYGMIDLSRAVMANDDKVMKEAQNKLIKRIVYAVIIFFVVAIVQLVFGMLATASNKGNSNMKMSKNNMTSCIDCFINGNNCKNAAN